MATAFDMSGLLGGNDLSGFLSPQQQQAIQQRGLLSAAAALLQAGGPSTTRIGLGQALGSALEAGQAGAERAQQSVLTQILTKQKLDEARRQAEVAQNFRDFFGGTGTGVSPAVTPAQALAAPGMAVGPTMERAAMIGQPVASAMPAASGSNLLNLLTPEQRQIISTMNPQQGLQEILKISAQAAEFGPEQTVIRDGKPVVIRLNKLGQERVVSGASPVEAAKFGQATFAVRDGKPVMIQTNQFGQERIVESAAPAESAKFGPATLAVRGGKPVMIQTNQLGQERIVEGAAPTESLQFGKAEPAVRGGQTVMVQTNPFGEERIVGGAAPYQATPTDIFATEYILGRPLAGAGPQGMAAVGQYREQLRPSTTVTVPVDMTGGQKGFENEMKLASAFKGEPIYKDFNEMKSAYGQVISSLNQGTPIGDVAGATKVMKLLDPGSVVRESELGIAMAASGRMDRLRNYFDLWASGNKLTPTQRDDFRALSNELYAAAGQAYNAKRDEYKGFGQAYNFRNLDAALGAAANVPSIVRREPPGGGAQTPGGEQRRSLAEIFRRNPPAPAR